MAKSPDAFRTISEAADEVAVPQHVLRFWETKFEFLTPLKRAGGRRFYRPADIVVLRAVKRLLHDEGMTIRGVQRLYAEQGLKHLSAFAEAGSQAAVKPRRRSPDADASAGTPSGLDQILAGLEAAKARLDAVLSA